MRRSLGAVRESTPTQGAHRWNYARLIHVPRGTSAHLATPPAGTPQANYCWRWAAPSALPSLRPSPSSLYARRTFSTSSSQPTRSSSAASTPSALRSHLRGSNLLNAVQTRGHGNHSHHPRSRGKDGEGGSKGFTLASLWRRLSGQEDQDLHEDGDNKPPFVDYKREAKEAMEQSSQMRTITWVGLGLNVLLGTGKAIAGTVRSRTCDGESLIPLTPSFSDGQFASAHC